MPAAVQDHAESTSQTFRAAQQLGSDVHTQAVDAFTDAMGTGLYLVAVVVLIVAVAVAQGLRRDTHEP